MEKMKQNFNGQFRERTTRFAVSVNNFLKKVPVNEINRTVISQLMRSASSIAANFRAATQNRPEKEYYAKISLIVEECDETILWLDLLNEFSPSEEIAVLKKEAVAMLKIFSSTKKKLVKSSNHQPQIFY